MAYASARYDALRNILATEMQALGPDIRAVIVTDFEKTSATALVEGVLMMMQAEQWLTFRAILGTEDTDRLDPVLMTGTTVLVDDDLWRMARFESGLWRNLDIKFDYIERGEYFEIRGKGKLASEYYTMMMLNYSRR